MTTLRCGARGREVAGPLVQMATACGNLSDAPMLCAQVSADLIAFITLGKWLEARAKVGPCNRVSDGGGYARRGMRDASRVVPAAMPRAPPLQSCRSCWTSSPRPPSC